MHEKPNAQSDGVGADGANLCRFLGRIAESGLSAKDLLRRNHARI
jgi:hypothetical protein